MRRTPERFFTPIGANMGSEVPYAPPEQANPNGFVTTELFGFAYLFWIILINVTSESPPMVTLGELLSNHGTYKAINHHVLYLSMVSMYYYRNYRHNFV